MATEDLSIKISDDPEIYLTLAKELSCSLCGRQIALIIRGDPECVFCMISRSGRSTITLAGWQIHRTSHGQITANRIPQSTDG